MGPHYVFGLSWGEMSAIVGIVVLLIGLFIWLANMAITKPMQWSNKLLQQSIDQLTKQVEGIGGNAEAVHKDHDRRINDLEKNDAIQDRILDEIVPVHHRKEKH